MPISITHTDLQGVLFMNFKFKNKLLRKIIDELYVKQDVIVKFEKNINEYL